MGPGVQNLLRSSGSSSGRLQFMALGVQILLRAFRIYGSGRPDLSPGVQNLPWAFRSFSGCLEVVAAGVQNLLQASQTYAVHAELTPGVQMLLWVSSTHGVQCSLSSLSSCAATRHSSLVLCGIRSVSSTRKRGWPLGSKNKPKMLA